VPRDEPAEPAALLDLLVGHAGWRAALEPTGHHLRLVLTRRFRILELAGLGTVALDDVAHLLRHLLVHSGSVFRVSAIHGQPVPPVNPGQTVERHPV
jgi:hypothetical protein